MRLALDAPAGWTRDGDSLTRGSTRVTAQVLARDDRDPRGAIEAGVAADGRADYVQVLEPLATAAGTAMKLATVEVLDAAGVRVEIRIAAVYELGERVGVAVARIAPGELDRDRVAVLDILRSARVEAE